MSGSCAVIVIGEAIADFLPRDDVPSAFACVPGGSGFNTALALARLGLTARYVWSLSTDALGRRLAGILSAEGVDMAQTRFSDAPMPVAIVSPAAASHGAMFALHLAGTAHETPPDLAALDVTGAGHVHVASFAGTTGEAGEAALPLLARFKANGTASYDPNIRAACLPTHRIAVELVEARVAASTIAKASEEDLRWLYPGLAPHEALSRWLALGSTIAIATRGDKGALAMTAHGFAEVPSAPAKVVDTVGAGDAFSAGFLAAMAEDGALGVPRQVPDPDQLPRWLAFASRVAAITCSRAGCDPPRLSDVV